MDLLIRTRLLGIVSLCLTASVFAATYPSWWYSRDVIKSDPNVTIDDYGAINQGQVKQLATAAYDEFNDRLPNGAGPDLDALIKSWHELEPTGEFKLDITGNRIPKVLPQTESYAVTNLRQLKTVAKPFYDRLISLGIESQLPWTGSAESPDDWAVVNIGQAKNLFDFNFQSDRNNDGFPDWWKLGDNFYPNVGGLENTHLTSPTDGSSVHGGAIPAAQSRNVGPLDPDVPNLVSAGVGVASVPGAYGQSAAALGWTNSDFQGIAGITHYQIYRRQEMGLPSDDNWTLLSAIPVSAGVGGAFSVVDTGLVYGYRYSYRIRPIRPGRVFRSESELDSSKSLDFTPSLSPSYSLRPQLADASYYAQKPYYNEQNELVYGPWFSRSNDPGGISQEDQMPRDMAAIRGATQSALNSTFGAEEGIGAKWRDVAGAYFEYDGFGDNLPVDTETAWCNSKGTECGIHVTPGPFSGKPLYGISPNAGAMYGDLELALPVSGAGALNIIPEFQASKQGFYGACVFYLDAKVKEPNRNSAIPESIEDTVGLTVRPGQSFGVEMEGPFRTKGSSLGGGSGQNDQLYYTVAYDTTSFEVTYTEVNADGSPLPGKVYGNGSRYVVGNFDELTARGTFNFYVRPEAAPTANNLITVTAHYLGLTVSDTIKVKVVTDPDFSDYTIPIDEASGPRYRKVGLNGRPIADSKPQFASGGDPEPEETYIDAMTLGLRHSTTDIYIPIPGSEMALSVRRDLSPEIWTTNSGLRPHERPNRPFGAGWHTNIAPHLEIRDGNGYSEQTVTDFDGAVHRFIDYVAMPSGQHEADSYLDTFTDGAGADVDCLIFQKKGGQRIAFAPLPGLTRIVKRSREDGVDSGSDTYTYRRAIWVEDRLHNRVEFSYSGTSLIPHTITAVKPATGSIRIDTDARGLVTDIWDLNQNKTHFTYQEYSTPTVMDPTVKEYLLTEVKSPDPLSPSTKYSWNVALVPDQYTEPVHPMEPSFPARDNPSYYFVDLASVTDPNNHAYGFTYEIDLTRKNLNSKREYIPQFPCPRRVDEVTLPVGTTKVKFKNLSDVKLAYNGGQYSMAGNRTTQVIDAEKNATTYDFSSVKVVLMNGYVSDFRAATRMLCYENMAIQYQKPVAQGSSTYISVGSESFVFDVTANMALKKTTDFSGNITEFIHGEIYTPPPGLYSLLGFRSKHSEVTRQINAKNKQKDYTYTNDVFRLPLTVINEVGSVTTYERAPSTGNLISETTTGPRGGTLKTSYLYENANVPGLPTKRKEVKQIGATDPVLPVTVGYVYTTAGFLQSEIRDPGGLNLNTNHTYDANGNRLTTVDLNLNRTAFHYDALNRLFKVVYPGLTSKETGYDFRGNKTSEKDENGDITTFSYDAGNRLEWTLRDGVKTRFEYNLVNSQTAVIDGRGKRTERTYDALQRLVDVKDARNKHTTYEYGANCGAGVFESTGFKPTAIVDARGYRVETDYDELYRSVETRAQFKKSPDPVEYAKTVRIYDDAGLLIKERAAVSTLAVAPVIRETIHDYDALGREFKVTYPGGAFKQTIYSSTGRVWKTIDERGFETVTGYDAVGRAITTTGPVVEGGQPVTENYYDGRDNLLWTRDARNNTTYHYYDSRNRKVKTVGPAVTGVSGHATWIFGYDAVGRQTAVIDPLNHITYTGYDAFGRKRFQQDALNNLHEWRYDPNGNLIDEVDALGRKTTNIYDELNRLTKTVDPMKIAVQFEYDDVGNQTKVIDGRLKETTMEYDGMSRLTKTTDCAVVPKSTTLIYDALNKTGRVDGKVNTTTYYYDLRNRLKNVIYSSAPDEDLIYDYDDSNNLLSVLRANVGSSPANVVYTYDALNRVKTETSSGYTHTYHHDLAGNRTGINFGGSGQIRVDEFDEMNRLKSITEGGRVTSYTYDAAGNVLNKTLPNQDQVTSLYDELNRVKVVTGTSTYGTGIGLYSFNYKYDPVGNLVESAETYGPGSAVQPRTLKMSYDKSNRLVREEEIGGQNRITTHIYDNLNNRTETSVTGAGSTIFSYNDLNQLTGSAGPTGTFTYQYDFNGNRTSRSGTVNSLLYTYDRENRLVAVAGNHHGNSLSETYVYDYRSRRVSRVENGNPVKVVFSGGTSVQEWNGTSIAAEFSRGPDMGGGVGGLLYTWRAGEGFSIAHSNNRGDIVTRTDGAGVLKWQAAYEAFGTRTQVQGTTNERQMANTKEEDATGLLNEGLRYRDLETGTFLTRDPAGFVDGPNLYCYVRQNPWTKFDPEGLNALPLLPFVTAGEATVGITAGVAVGTVAIALAPVALVAGCACIPNPKSTGVPNREPGVFNCNSGRQISASRPTEGGLIMPQENQADRDAYSRFLMTGDRRSLDDYLGARSSGNPGGGTAKDTVEANQKKVPSPNGKNGGPEHQAKVGEVEKDVADRGLVPQREYKVPTPDGEKGYRYVDVVGKDPQTGEVKEMHQVGKQTQGGKPVARERRAIGDIEKATGTKPEFHPYNR